MNDGHWVIQELTFQYSTMTRYRPHIAQMTSKKTKRFPNASDDSSVDNRSMYCPRTNKTDNHGSPYSSSFLVNPDNKIRRWSVNVRLLLRRSRETTSKVSTTLTKSDDDLSVHVNQSQNKAQNTYSAFTRHEQTSWMDVVTCTIIKLSFYTSIQGYFRSSSRDTWLQSEGDVRRVM